ncbi:hydrogenase maturation nickel metallochaperone HypA [Halobacteria archaeon HArc-curdl5-1]|uniref:Hydrogenase maturation nickel metallochaperone HypA n=1 Tax=Halapricum hydrolyticum TaxID=2979991 RepID=A0ABT2Q6D5_9EURY|nr:hydrogenase maturation nickel metallochaperone HypA [Halapricum hydrolyticum]
MGVLDRAARLARGDSEPHPYRCMSCGADLSVQYHSCPECGGYDIRAAKWVDE